MTTEKRHVFRVEIEAPAEKVWQAIIDPEMTRQYYHETGFTADLRPGGVYAYKSGDGEDVLTGEILEVDPPRKLVTTFSAQWADDISAEPPSRVTWEIEQKGSQSVVTVIHDQLEESPATYERVSGGWPGILARMKELLGKGRVTAAA
jgi:uncharacterized protein YndB with AHSA1/START domain